MPDNAGYAWGTKPLRYSLKTPHDLGITELIVRLHEHHEQIIEFYNDVTIRSVGIKPDALIRTNSSHYFVEVDMGTQGSGAITQKLRSYKRLYESGEWTKAFDEFPVLLLATRRKYVVRIEVPFKIVQVDI